MVKDYYFCETRIKGVLEIEAFEAADERGHICKEYSGESYRDRGIDFTPSESMVIYSHRGALRGVHLQRKMPQNRIVRCIRGTVFAVAIDLRSNSNTFGEWIGLDINNGKETYIPHGCAFGTLAMEESIISCMFDGMHYQEYASGVVWNDETLNIRWPIDINDIIVSDRDKSLPSFDKYVEEIEGEV